MSLGGFGEITSPSQEIDHCSFSLGIRNPSASPIPGNILRRRNKSGRPSARSRHFGHKTAGTSDTRLHRWIQPPRHPMLFSPVWIAVISLGEVRKHAVRDHRPIRAFLPCMITMPYRVRTQLRQLDFPASQIYRRARACRGSADLRAFLSQARVPVDARKGIRRLLADHLLCEVFDELDTCEALMSDFPSGHLNKFLSLDWDEVSPNIDPDGCKIRATG